MRTRLYLSAKLVLMMLLLAVPALADQRFVANLSGAQQIPANNSAGKGVCSIILNDAETQISVNCNYSNLPGAPSAAHVYGNAAVGSSGGVLFDLTPASGGFSGTFSVTAAQVADLRAKRWYIGVRTAQFAGGELRGQIKFFDTAFDADGDGRSDVYVYRPGNNTFYFQRSLDGSLHAQTFGQESDIAGIRDFDGDGKADLLALRIDAASGAATAFILRSNDNTIKIVQWGNVYLADSPAPADYDGDGKLDVAVFRRSTGVWYILQSSTDTPRYEYFGRADDIQVTGDFDKDGKTDLAVVRSENGNKIFYIRRSSDGVMRSIAWGLESDQVFPNLSADVDGDGASDPLVIRHGANGSRTFYALRSSDNQIFALQWGLESDAPIIGDYDGDGKTDFVARRVNAAGHYVWYIYQSSNGQARIVFWGLLTDV